MFAQKKNPKKQLNKPREYFDEHHLRSSHMAWITRTNYVCFKYTYALYYLILFPSRSRTQKFKQRLSCFPSKQSPFPRKWSAPAGDLAIVDTVYYLNWTNCMSMKRSFKVFRATEDRGVVKVCHPLLKTIAIKHHRFYGCLWILNNVTLILLLQR